MVNQSAFAQSRGTHTATVSTTAKVDVSDSYFGYFFQVPATWLEFEGTANRRMFISDPIALAQGDLAHHSGETFLIPEGIIKVDFGADTAASRMPEPTDVDLPTIEGTDIVIDVRARARAEDIIPFLPQGTWTTIASYPALIVTEKRDTPSGDGPFTESTSIYILAERMVYQFWVGYAPPADSSKSESSYASYESAIQILTESFMFDASISPNQYQEPTAPVLEDTAN